MAPVLEVRGVSKDFPGVRALADVCLSLEKGEIRALAGENGAGKSTLMNILAGSLVPDAGEILLRGRPVHFASPRDSLRQGIAMIYQELTPVRQLTVAENIFLGREPVAPWGGWVRREEMNRRASELCSQIGVFLDPRRRVGELSVAEVQLVEILKALSHEAEILIMDEPTSALSSRESQHLLAIIRQLAEQGRAILYISHRLDELYAVAHSVTVLRDGCHMATRAMKELNRSELIALMVGRDLTAIYPARTGRWGDVLLEVQGLSADDAFSDVSFQVQAGEILGVAGLMGAGRTEVMETICGLRRHTAGRILVRGRPSRIQSPCDAKRLGIAMVSEDRKESELNLKASVKDNMTMANLATYCRFGWIRGRGETAAVNEKIREQRIKTSSYRTPVVTLSGGNQQKVVLAKWLLGDPDILILDEPTRGIDVGAKAEIHRQMADLAARGKAIVMVSSELPEVMGMSDRILVLHAGRVTGAFSAAEATPERIMACATGQNGVAA